MKNRTGLVVHFTIHLTQTNRLYSYKWDSDNQDKIEIYNLIRPYIESLHMGKPIEIKKDEVYAWPMMVE